MQCRWLIALSVLLCLCATGCSRRHYRLRADADSYALLAEKSAGTPWQLPSDYSVYPDPGSRLADPTNPDRPQLPPPGPVLYRDLPISAAGAVPQDALGPGDVPRLIGANGAKPLNDIRPLPPVQLASAELLQPPIPAEGPLVDEVELKEQEAADVQPIPAAYWDALPARYLRRMFEFKSVRAEYAREYGSFQQERDTGQRLSLSDIINLARENSREYQTQKQDLYVAALGVSLDRYEYYLKFSSSGNGTALDYSNNRDNGETVNVLAFPAPGSNLQVDRMLATGGTILARFANDVLLTFNGPDGFTADVASELLFDFTQSILQRDVLLEPLIQSERDLVYGARDFARFRKEFFLQLARQYYGILQTYRNIEIQSQNYFSLVRTVEEAQAEVRADVQNAPNQVEVDQFEQEMLNGRSVLISVCNALETSLDQLKLAMGLPTEIEININLEELDRLTLLDETEVAAERVRRWQRRVQVQRQQPLLNRGDLLNPDYFLLERLLQWIRLRQQTDESITIPPQLQQLFLDIDVALAFVDVKRTEQELARAADPVVPQPTILLYQRTADLIAAKIELARRQLKRLAATGEVRGAERQQWNEQIRQADERLQVLSSAVAEILEDPQQERLDKLLTDSQALLAVADRVDDALRGLAQWSPDETEAERKQQTIEATDQLLRLTEEALRDSQGGLPPINITENDAMLTALVQRLDLMNERGLLADDWRRIKYAADDLRSVLNFNASHALRTDKNSPFNFDFDDSRTNLRLSLDLPLNRRAQRNDYRASLINYQQGRQDVMLLEDSIKFQIRDGLRGLAETRVQYPISVTQAALAAEQVISVQLQLALGIEGVRGTDLLLALQSSRESLSDVAQDRIGYLVERAQFVLDLELMQLNAAGFWPEINDPNYQPQPRTLYPPNAGPTYGEITPWVKPSKLIYQIYRHPLPGENTVLVGDQPDDAANEEELRPTQPVEELPAQETP